MQYVPEHKTIIVSGTLFVLLVFVRS